MGLNTEVDWIVCYDMADRKRLARIFKLLKSHGIPLQRSVFLIHTSSVGMEKLEIQINSLINPKEDDVRAYRLPQSGQKFVLGRPLILQDMLFGEELNSWQTS